MKKLRLEEQLQDSKPSLVAFIHAAESDAVEVRNITKELTKKYGDKANILRMDTSYDRPAIRRYKLNAYPTYILFKEGQELMRESGNKNLNELSQLIERAL